MNSYRSSNKSSNSNKPFCKVCYDAGKPEREYTSHYVKNKPGNEGKVVCPYLLSLVCTYCKKQEGHTAKHCPVLFAKSSSSSRSSGGGVTVTVSIKDNDDGWTCVGERKGHNKPAQQAPAKQQRNLAESPVTPPPTSGKKIVQWSTIVKNAPPTKTKPIVVAPPVIVTTPTLTDKAILSSFRVIIPEDDDYVSDGVEEEECAAVSGSSGYCYGAYSTAAVTSSGNWADDIEDY